MSLVITNGMIWDGTHAPFSGTVICNNRITSVTRGAPESIPDGATILDAKGGSVIPALTDVHQHFSASAHKNSPKFVSLHNVRSIEEAVNVLIAYSETIKPGEWIFGWNLNHNQFPGQKMPTRLDFDAVPNPLVVAHQCGHTYFVNSLAIEKVGESKFDDIEGVHRDAEGKMTGVLDDGADRPLWPHFEDYHGDGTDDWVQCMREALAVGIAEVHAISADVILSGESIRAYEKLRAEGKLAIRIRLYMTEAENPGIESDEWLSYGGRKIFLDGAFGGRTAAMREPFTDANTKGILKYSDEELYKTAKDTFERGSQLMAHVIGDRGLDQLLRVLERLSSEGVKSEWPVKITHCELCHPDQVERIARLGAFCDVQPAQLTTEAGYLKSVIGAERMQHCFPFRSMIDAGITIAGASDAPVESDNPLAGIQAAVVRHPAMNLAECISLDEGLKMYTINAQKLIKNDHQKGLLKPGYVADIAVFQEDLFAVAPEALSGCKVAATVVNGRIAYERGE
jgi:predicted amidohydrolase YtcJ